MEKITTFESGQMEKRHAMQKKIPVIIQISNENTSINDRNLKKISGKNLGEYLISRIQECCDSRIVISTSDSAKDDMYEEIALKKNVKIVRANYSNIVERIQKAMDALNADHAVRVFANYPLLDIGEMKTLYEEHIQGEYDYSYNEHIKGVLWGTGCEVFGRTLADRLGRMNLNTAQQETLSFFIRQNAGGIRCNKAIRCKERAGYRLLLETEKDYEVISEIAENVSVIDNAHICDYLSAHKVLAKYNYEVPPQEVGLEKIFLHPGKVEKLLNEGQDMSYPISVELTLTNVCNLDCCYCSDKELRLRQGIRQTFDMDVLKRLFADLANGGTTGVTFEGGGEPTLYPEFGEAVKEAKKAGLAVGLITNGTVKLSEEVLKEFEWIRVSLDASNAKEYLELKGVDVFEKVVSNIAHYAEYCDTVGIGYVVTKNNLSQIESLVMRLREVKAAYIQMRPVVDCPELYPKDIDLSYLNLYQTKEFGVMINGMVDNAKRGNHKLPCMANGITSVISGDGAVYLCGRLNIYQWIAPIGNINEQTFHDIWYGEERKKQCEMVMDPDFCEKNCPQCRVSKFNQMINKMKMIKSKNFI